MREQTSQSEQQQKPAGVLTQQVELNNERLEIGIVTHAKFIRETLAILDKLPGAAVTQARVAKPEPIMPGATPAAAVSAMAMGASH